MTEQETHRKGDILAVGTFDENGMPVGWTFKGGSFDFGFYIEGTPPELTIENCTTHNARWAGYTLEELHQIAANQP